jgi:hypothetical protein
MWNGCNSKDQTKKKDQMKEQTEADRAVRSIAEQMLGIGPKQQRGPARVILNIDATTSMGEWLPERRITPEDARSIAEAVCQPGVQVQLCYFRGDDEFHVSEEWYTTPEALARGIEEIEPLAGWTQHCVALRHAISEAEQQAVAQVVTITDAFERRTSRRPNGDDLKAAQVYAQRLRDLGTTVNFAYKGTIQGGCPLDRSGPGAEECFRAIAKANVSAFKWRLRKSLIVRKSGGSSATIITKSFRSLQALAMRRDEYSPLA